MAFRLREPVAGGCVRCSASDYRHHRLVNFRTIAPAWFDYVTEEVVGHTKFREWTANLTFDGPLFRLPGGDAQAVVGHGVSQVEHQRRAFGRRDQRSNF